MDKLISFFKKNNYLLIILIVLLGFVGLAFPLVNGHGVIYNSADWTFEETPRITHNVAMLFGMDGALVWPLIVVLSLIIIGIFLVVLTLLHKKLVMIAILLFFVSGVLLLLSNHFYAYANAISTAKAFDLGDYYYWYISSYITTVDARLEPGAIIMSTMCFLAAITGFALNSSKDRLNVRDMTEMGVLISLAIVLDIIFHYIPNIPGQVGSVSIALLPLYILSLRHGATKGLLASSFVYGLITCFTDNYGIWLYPLDYMVAFSGVAIIGLVKDHILNEKVNSYNFKGLALIFVSVMLAGLVRLVGSGASSILNYNYTFNSAVAVNGLYTILSSLACSILLMIMYKPIIQINKRFPVNKGLSD